jgi:exopolysaccharide production protein ExoQ
MYGASEQRIMYLAMAGTLVCSGVCLSAFLAALFNKPSLVAIAPALFFSVPLGAYMTNDAIAGGRGALLAWIACCIVIVSLGLPFPGSAQSMLKFAVICGAFALGVIGFNDGSKLLKTPLGMIILIYWFLTLLTMFISATPFYTLGSSFALIAWILFAAAAAARCGARELHLALLTGTSVLLVGSWFVYVLVPEIGTTTFVSGRKTVARFIGLAGSPNGAGQIAALHLMVFASLYASGLHRSCRRLLIVAMAGVAVLAIGALVLSQSRGSALALVATALVLFAQRTRSMPLVIAGFALAAFSMLALPGLIDWLTQILPGVSRGGRLNEILTLTGRTHVWSFVAEKAMESPIYGFGYGAGKEIITQGFRNVWGGGIGGSAHNAFLQTLLDLGILGAATFSAIFVHTALSFVTRPVFFRDAIGVMVLMIGLLESGVSNSIEALTPVWLLALFFGLRPASPVVGDDRDLAGARAIGLTAEVASGPR